MNQAALQPRSAGEIVDTGFRLYRRHFLTFVEVGLLLMVPAAFLDVFGSPLIGSLAATLAHMLAIGAMVYLASQAFLGEPVSLGLALKTGGRAILPLLIWGVLYSLGLMVGFMLLIVPGILLVIRWFAWIPVVVIERRWDPFGRCATLAKGAGGRIALVSLLCYLIAALPVIALHVGAIMLSEETGASAFDVIEAPWMTFATSALGALTLPFSNCVLTVLYYDQRVRREGFDVSHSAADLGDVTAAAEPSA